MRARISHSNHPAVTEIFWNPTPSLPQFHVSRTAITATHSRPLYRSAPDDHGAHVTKARCRPAVSAIVVIVQRASVPTWSLLSGGPPSVDFGPFGGSPTTTSRAGQGISRISYQTCPTQWNHPVPDSMREPHIRAKTSTCVGDILHLSLFQKTTLFRNFRLSAFLPGIVRISEFRGILRDVP